MVLVDEIAVGVMFNDKTTWIFPVVKDLASEYVSSHTPNQFIALL